MADRPNPHTPAPLLSLYALLFFAGWVLARGANLQKFWFKRDPTAKAFGVLEPRAISGDGKHVLAGGFWGLSRHINYLGEILMATALTLCLGYPRALARLALPALLRGAAVPAPALRRPALRREVRPAVGRVLPARAEPDHPRDLLTVDGSRSATGRGR